MCRDIEVVEVAYRVFNIFGRTDLLSRTRNVERKKEILVVRAYGVTSADSQLLASMFIILRDVEARHRYQEIGCRWNSV